MDLLNLCLTSINFQYNGKHYKQLHGTAMGSPVSVVVAEIVMQHVEERALATCRQTIPLWLRYIYRNIYRSIEADATNRNPTPVTTVTIPYIKGTSETISRILQPYIIRVAHKPTTTLRHLLTNLKDRDEPNNRQGAVYKIKCSDCQASYIGETGRNLNTRLTEHKRATKNGDVNNHIAVHHQLTNHPLGHCSMLNLQYELFSTTDS